MNETILQNIDRRGVVTLTLNRPEINNAYDDALIDAVLGAIDQLAGIDTARALVVQANGRHFQAGADLGWLARIAGESAAANVRAHWSRERASAAVPGSSRPATSWSPPPTRSSRSPNRAGA